MNVRNQIVFALTASLLSASAFALAPRQTSADAGLKIMLKELKEVRLRHVAKDEDSDNSFGFNQPGLFLTFALEGAKGRSILSIEEPDTMRAVDSRGRDLTKKPPSKFGQNKLVEVPVTFDEPTTEFTVSLATSSRTAETFNLATTLNIATYQSTKQFEAMISPEFSALPTVHFDGKEMQAAFKEGGGFFGGDGTSLTVKPGIAQQYIEEITIQTDDGEIESQGSSWNDSSVTYYFSQKLEGKKKVRFSVRTGFQEDQVVVSIQDQQLP